MAAVDDLGGVGIHEAARQLGVSKQTLRRWIWRGKVKAALGRSGGTYRLFVSLDDQNPGPKPEADEGVAAESAGAHTALDPASERASRHPADPADPLRAADPMPEMETRIRQLEDQTSELRAEIERLGSLLSESRRDRQPPEPHDVEVAEARARAITAAGL